MLALRPARITQPFFAHSQEVPMSRRFVEPDVLSVPSIQSGKVTPSAIKIRILIVSDVRLYREALASRLDQHDHLAIVGAVDCSGAVREVCRFKPDLVLLDIGEWHGLDLATTLLRQQPDLGIVAIGVPEIAGSAFAATCRGIAGFVPRDGSVDDVIAELDRLTACTRVEQIPIAPSAEVPHNTAKSIIAPRSRAGELTPRECEILEMIELGLTNKDIARRLGIEVGTVKNHVHNILEKLNVRCRNQAAHRLRARTLQQEDDI
jgi:two-component system, NarL family, nitrate/nitrite response regulator NarL